MLNITDTVHMPVDINITVFGSQCVQRLLARHLDTRRLLYRTRLITHIIHDAVKPVVEKLYDSVKTGNEAQISIDSNSQPDYREKLNEELRQLRESEMWQTAVTVRQLRPENN